MDSEADDELRFFSLRGLEPGAADDPDSPVGELIARLQAAGIGFALHEILLERDAAAAEPDNSDLYPNGPDSGPPHIVVYEFLAHSKDLAAAELVARQYTGEAG